MTHFAAPGCLWMPLIKPQHHYRRRRRHRHNGKWLTVCSNAS